MRRNECANNISPSVDKYLSIVLYSKDIPQKHDTQNLPRVDRRVSATIPQYAHPDAFNGDGDF